MKDTTSKKKYVLIILSWIYIIHACIVYYILKNMYGYGLHTNMYDYSLMVAIIPAIQELPFYILFFLVRWIFIKRKNKKD